MRKKSKILLITLIIFLMIVGCIIALLTHPISFEPIETKEIRGKIIEKRFWFSGPIFLDDESPWYYHNWASVKIECENGWTYEETSYLYSTIIIDPLVNYKEGDQVICEVTLDDSRLISFREA